MPTKKVIKINLDLNEINLFKNDPYESNETFWTTDINSAFLEFSTTSDISNSNASLVLYNPEDKSLVQRNIEVAESPFSYMLREEEVTRYGHWYGQIVVEKDGKSLTDAVFRFHIKGSLLDSTDPALIDIDNYNKLSSQLMILYNQFNGYLDDVELSEEKRELAEGTRKQLFEDSQRIRGLDFEASQLDNKNIFQSSELERKNLFEDSQSEKATLFDQSEIERTETFTDKENNRDSVFETNETIRKDNELERELAESIRAAADSTRDETFQSSQVDRTNKFNQSESTRAETFTNNETDRRTNEQARKTEELNRVSAETERKQSETARGTNEQTRQSNETNRISSFGTYDDRIKVVEDTYKVQATNISPIKTATYEYNENVTASTPYSLSIYAKHKYYISLETNYSAVPNEISNLYFGSGQGIGRFPNVVGIKKSSYLVEPLINNAVIRVYPRLITSGSKLTIDNMIVIDLTETFGVGNEPTQTQMDKILSQFTNSWFDGVQNLFVAKEVLNRVLKDERELNMNATNLIENGDFSKGLTGWTSNSGSLSASDGILKVVSNGSYPLAHVNSSNLIPANVKIYYRGEAKIYDESSSMLLLSTISSVNKIVATINKPLKNMWYLLSGITQESVAHSFRMYSVYDRDVISLGKTMDVKNALCIDLTTTFGAGNEPTQSQMDRLLAQFPNSWFDGTQNLFNARAALAEMRSLDSLKANVKQEDWITPTLTNGATGTVKYRKNSLGRLEFKGLATVAQGTSQFQLPTGYYPKELTTFFLPMTASPFALRSVQLQATGTFYVTLPYGVSELNFNGVSLPLD